MSSGEYILRAAAPDAIGILADVMGHLASHRLNVIESHDFGDPETKRFFIWARFQAEDGFQPAAFEDGFGALADRRQIDWSLRRADAQPKALIMVSKGDHCLNDLLYRHRRGRLGADIVAVVSNHPDGKWHADRHDIPFHHVPVTKDTKVEAENHLKALIAETGAEIIVLARYMQILSNELSRELEGRCINIHHSALPSFKGARPYHQAHARGVKLMGATAHYVTADLDEGPIIAQDVMAADHRMTAERMVELGKDVEARVLARAVSAHAEGRVFLNGHRTVVFE
ncbi:formyltetrahydrofolate deformylase [Hyphomonas sp. FCG-A18]|uniref:formyltetrahydrofolate deformylase n=1 Tax=Hyphomonas sp. FCG-A18 TaxID=3080019 RepID=UPI002B2D7088|nr:formyltetrahydrofolate deformylase [Hyphomonas sp. FCG-A18]